MSCNANNDNNNQITNETSAVSKFRSFLESSSLKDYKLDDKLLLKFLRSRSYDIEKTFKLLSNYLEIIPERSDLFTWKDLFSKMVDSGLYYQHQTKTPEGCKLLIAHVGQWDPAEYSFDVIISATLFYSEITLMDEGVQRAGCVAIFDMRGLTWNQIYHCGASNGRISSYLSEKCFPWNLLKIHVVYENWLTDLGYALFKPFLGDLRNQIIFHGHDLDSFHKFVPPSCLPPSLGGTDIPYDPVYYKKLLTDNKDKVLNHWNSLCSGDKKK